MQHSFLIFCKQKHFIVFVFILLIIFRLTAQISYNQAVHEPSSAVSPDKSGIEKTQQENTEQLKASLKEAMRKSDPFETVRLIDRLLKSGTDPKTLPLIETADLIQTKCIYAYQWEAISGEELIQLCAPLEGLLDGNWRENSFYASYFWGLMSTGQREKALGIWNGHKKAIDSLLSAHYPADISRLPWKEVSTLNNLKWAISFYVLGFTASGEKDDKLKAVELAKRNYDWELTSYNEKAKIFQTTNPVAESQVLKIIYSLPHSLLLYALAESGLGTNEEINPFLRDQPETNMHFRIIEGTGFEESSKELSLVDDMALGDFDGDGYVDVLFPDQGLWRNLNGTGKFRCVDQELGAYIHGPIGGFADVNNDGLVDIITAGPGKFAVAVQMPDHTFQSITNASDSVAQSPGGLGLFDGDADGFIDVFLSGYEGGVLGKSTRCVVLHNLGNGRFEDVTETWGFTGEDIMLCGHGVSPCDYDSDGYTDIYVSNYRLNRNTLWHNISEKDDTKFVQCASAPWFGKEKPYESPAGTDRGIEGRHGIYQNKTYWGHSEGSVWGDLNGDGTFDLVCTNLAHPRDIVKDVSDLSRVYLNTGDSFRDNSVAAGLVYRETNADPLLADFDNDGDLDLSVTNSYRIFENQFFEGSGDGSFREVTFRIGAFAANSPGQASGDFDNDGDLDWFIIDGNKGVLVYENMLIENKKTPQNANWIEIKLVGGKKVNSMAYGVNIKVMAKDKVYVREISGMRGMSNCDDQVIHIGLGDYRGPVDAEICWGGENVRKISRLKSNRRHLITEPVN